MPAAYEKFGKTIERSVKLLKLYGVLQNVRNKLPAPNHPISDEDACDLLRSAVVLAVSGMDAYFTDKFAELLVPFLKTFGPTPGVVHLLSEAGLDTKTALEMLAMDRPYRRVRTLVGSHLENYTTQRAQVIDKLFLAFGLKDLCANVAGIAKRKKLIRRVETLVLRRHSIAHEADLNAHGRLRHIALKAVVKQLNDLKLFVDESEKLRNKAIQV